MCGITGWIDWNEDLKQKTGILEDMTKAISSRGPDDENMWISNCAAFGHRRLIVIDPEGGAQPMLRQREENLYVITYNGELYNTEELRKDLIKQGYKFKGHSDTEVLLLSYMEWGISCVERLNGIYAFGIWDDREQRLFLARDRLGVKPLFYSHQDNGLLFASEIKSLLANPKVKSEVGEEGLLEIFALGPAKTPGHGIYKNIEELRPGYYLIFDKNGIKKDAYWSLESKPHYDSIEATTEKIKVLFEDAVTRQLVSDVPVCTFLSGGVDSSAISAVASNYFHEKGLGALKTFSVDYVDNHLYFTASRFQPDEDAPWINRVSHGIKSRHSHIFIDTPQLVDALTSAVHARDLPGMADVDSSLYLFCKEIKKQATVALSGECADEIFGGYPWFYRKDIMDLNTFPWSGNIQLRKSVLSDELKLNDKLEEYINYRYTQTINEVPVLDGEDPMDKRRREIFYLNIVWFMNTLLDRKDRMSMASGLEVRVPFCDHRLMEYVWNVPWQMKNYRNREKGILRKALEGILPNEVLWRKKSPYPKTHNPAYMEAVKKILKSIINDPSSPLLLLIDKKIISNMISGDDHVNTPWFGQLMTGPQLFAYLIQINTWLTTYGVTINP